MAFTAGPNFIWPTFVHTINKTAAADNIQYSTVQATNQPPRSWGIPRKVPKTQQYNCLKMEITFKPTSAVQRIRVPLAVQVFGDLYPTKYMRKITDTFERMKF